MNKYMSGTVVFLSFLNFLLSLTGEIEFGWFVAFLGWGLVFLGDLE